MLKKSWHFVKYNFKKRTGTDRIDGILVNILFFILFILSSFHNSILEWLKKIFKISVGKKYKYNIENEKHIRKGWAIEFWHLINLFFNLWILIYIVKLKNEYPFWANWFSLQNLLFFIVFLRLTDLLLTLFLVNFRLNKKPQRSLPRSYVLLIFNFFEVATILSIFHFLFGSGFNIIPADHNLPCTEPTFGNLFYYTLRNMLTIGGGDLQVNSCDENLYNLFHILRILQPMFSVLIITMAISQTLNHKSWKKEKKYKKNFNYWNWHYYRKF